jgi:enhancing lycopene biosynthesis protein 2
VDKENNIFSTPAYMKDDAKPHEVFEGIDNMVREIAKKIKSK